MSLWDWHIALVAGKTERSRAKEQWQRVIAVSSKEARAMVFRIASIILRLCGALAVILGSLFWSGNALNLVPIHMLLRLLVVLSLWIVGIGQAFSRGGSWPMAGGAFLLGLLVLVGMRQSSLLVGPFHWVLQVVHLLLGMLAVGIGPVAAARRRNSSAVHEEQLSRAS